MKDVEARRQLAELEATIGKLPGAVAELVSKRFDTRLTTLVDDVNGTLERMRAAAVGMEGLARLVQQIGDATNENGELLGVLEQQFNTLRVDVNAIREAQAQQASDVVKVQSLLTGFAAGVQEAMS